MRDVVLGRGSKVWRALATHEAIARQVRHAIGHQDLPDFAFTPADRVWVLSYSHLPTDNSALLACLRDAGVREVVYVSSSSTIVGRLTHCYAYPRVKQHAEDEALKLPHAKVLTIGLVYEEATDLPAGDNVATSCRELAEFMLAPHWPDGEGRRKYLFGVVQRPFSGRVEHALYRAYGVLMTAASTHPCALRPLDLMLRALRMRWYGYTYLSNRLWISTIS